MSIEPEGLPARGESREIFVAGPAGRLEALLSMPRGDGPPAGLLLACHPHPLYGGALSNKVVYALANAALKSGMVALRFNFRGVGRSQGTYDEARGETDDAVAAAAWLRHSFPERPLVLAGFSFGAYISLKAAAQVHPAAQVSISIPFGRYVDQAAPPPHPGCPWLAVHSVDDDVVSWTETRAELQRYQPPPQIVELDGAGHFYHGRIGELQDIVTAFLRQSLPA
jgi:alpha/beta superfamily hydrolase